jgi:hypothetical protein
VFLISPSRARANPPALERIRHPEIAPIDLSDFAVGGLTLWESIQGRGFPFALRMAIPTLRHAGGAGRSRGGAVATAPAFEAIFVTGGQMADQSQRAWLSGFPWPVFFAREPVFGGARGGFECLRTRGLNGWVADLGQTQLKLMSSRRRWVFPRDWRRLRATGTVPLAEIPAQRRRLREFIALSLQIALAETVRSPRALVFALPARLAVDGTPGPSSYCGMSADRMLLPDALALAGLSDLPTFVLNDAELAALSARLDPRLAGFQRILVLTLGFGIGAALIQRRERSAGA